MDTQIPRTAKSKQANWMALLPLLVMGCATTYKADPKLVSQFKPAPPPSATETEMYVIRGNNFYGGARGVWVALNDKVVADLDNSSYVHLKVPSGINTLSIVQSLTAVAQTAVDNRNGETLFLTLNYAAGKFDIVERDLGMSMVMKTKRTEPLAEIKRNDGYDDVLMNPGRLGIPIMKNADGPIAPTSTSAVLTIFRSDKLIAPIPFDVWRGGEFAASLKGGEYIQVQLPPGRHSFVAKAERYSILEVDALAGKQYFAELDVGMGWNQAHIKLLPMDANVKDATRTGWLAKLTARSVDAAVVKKPELTARLADARTLINNVEGKVAAEQLEKRSLTAAMGR